MPTNNSINSSSPIQISMGGTNTNSMTNTDGVVYFDGTMLNTTAVGTSSYVLTSNGYGNPPSFQVGGGGGISTIGGDTGSVSGSSVAVITGHATQNCGSSVSFVCSGTTSTLNVADTNDNIIIGIDSGGTGITTAVANTILGCYACPGLTTGQYNVCIGAGAFNHLTEGDVNVAIGPNTGQGISTGSNSISIGNGAGPSGTNWTGNNVTSIGFNSGNNYLTSESNNIIIGVQTGVTGESNAIHIGDGTIRASSCFIAGIYGITVGGGTAVLVGSNGQLGTVVSAQKYKENIEDIGTSTDNLHNLRPVSFTYKGDTTKELHYGLIAEEVKTYFPDLVIHDKNNEIFSIKYHEMPALIINEMKKMADRITELEKKLGA